jgi:carbonic anhydrase/acetyltransferase-like protein (isoleucine patch superfamily)
VEDSAQPGRTHDLIRRPHQIAPTAFVADNATVLGDVTIGAESSIWFGTVIRGDVERISIGAQTNIQDLCLLHADPGFPCVIGDRVTVGHGAIVHGATVEDEALVGIRAVVLNGARIGRGSIVGAGALIPENFEVPPKTLFVGVPARFVRATTPADQQRARHAWENYAAAAKTARNR